MNYRQTLEYLYRRLPMFHRSGPAAYKADLHNTIALCGILGNPQDSFKSIHIAGTNGKGSVSHLLASILQSAGYKTGLYTSPHLKDMRERIRINGKMISREKVASFVSRHKNTFEEIRPSFFEMMVGMAFYHFRENKVDIAVIETGLGGRLDSTNIITPLLSVITNISYDHTALLGNTLQKIAGEKAGIIKPGVPVVIGETQDKVKQVFIRRAKKSGSPLFFADREYKTLNARVYYKNNKAFLHFDLFRRGEIFTAKTRCGLPGLYQQKNIPCAAMSVEILNSLGMKISNSSIRKGLSSVVKNTGLKGRWQVIGNNPKVVIETCHNEAGMREALSQVKQTSHKKLHFVLGTVSDKDIVPVLKLLPRNAAYYFCRAQIPRSMDQHLLAQKALKYGLRGTAYHTVKNAFSAAKKNAGKDDLILIGGSIFVCGEI